MKRLLLPLAAAAMIILAADAHAQDADQLLRDIQHRWAEINYQAPEQDRATALEALAHKAELAANTYPGDARLVTWEGIVYSTWAGAKGGLGALGLAKSARRYFEQAIEIDGTALAGSAHTSLGVLYHEVPGWPLGFGSETKARTELETGLKLNPDGIDSNYFLGTWLMDQKHYAEASVRLNHALEAPPRPGRPIADEGRREEVRQALKQLERQLARN